MTGKTKLLADNDEPLGWIILIPFDSVSIVHRELMVEVVVAFTDGDESSDEMVTRSVLIIEGGFSEIVSKRIDAEG